MGITKDLEGKKVYLRPTGNNAKGNGGKIYIAQVDKVAKVFITLTFEGSRWSDKLRFNGDDNSLDSGYNSGYVLFKTRQDVENKIVVEEIATAITKKYNSQHNYAVLDRETIEKVAGLLGVATNH